MLLTLTVRMFSPTHDADHDGLLPILSRSIPDYAGFDPVLGARQTGLPCIACEQAAASLETLAILMLRMDGMLYKDITTLPYTFLTFTKADSQGKTDEGWD